MAAVQAKGISRELMQAEVDWADRVVTDRMDRLGGVSNSQMSSLELAGWSSDLFGHMISFSVFGLFFSSLASRWLDIGVCGIM